MIKFYGSRESLIFKLKKLFHTMEIIDYYKIDNLSASISLIDDSKLSLYIRQIQEAPRSMSVRNPFNTVYSIETIINDEGLSEVFLHTLKRSFLSYSEFELEAIVNDMPLLNKYANKYKGAFNDVALIWRDHFVEDSLGLLQNFVNMGLDPSLTLVFDKGDKTLHRKEVWETFEEIGFGVHKLDNAMFNQKSKSSETETLEVKELLDNFINQANRKGKKIIIMDDGAFITNFFSNNTSKLHGIIELTEMGLRRITNSNINVQCPIINAAKSDLKRHITYPEIGAACTFKILQLLGSEKIIGRRILILGYGDAGKNICKNFKGLGVNVSVVDPDYFKLILAAEDGFNTYDNVTEAIFKEQPFLVVGASGYPSITEDDISLLPNNSFITTVATADLTVLKNKSFQKIKKITVPKYGTQYITDKKTFTLLGNGRSINLFEGESIPTKGIDLFKSSILLSAILLIEQKQKLEFGLNKAVLNQWLEENEVFKEYYNLYYKKDIVENIKGNNYSAMEVIK
ncbi:hypothetical protein [Priestia koreensis]|uniref:hypothetical protein n=1 Tax=Priestia koreensis TaxID=284581 RepID=UPI00301A5741